MGSLCAERMWFLTNCYPRAGACCVAQALACGHTVDAQRALVVPALIGREDAAAHDGGGPCVMQPVVPLHNRSQ